MNILVMIFAILFSVKNPKDEIYVGKSFPWVVYFDPDKVQPVVEIGGIKYGQLDFLKSEGENLHRSQEGMLYCENGNLFYKNKALNINVKLKKKGYSQKIDNQRYKIFEINAFNEVTKLKDSLKVEGYQFDGQVKDDYVFYRDNMSIPDNYTPNYKKEFYDSLN